MVHSGSLRVHSRFTLGSLWVMAKKKKKWCVVYVGAGVQGKKCRKGYFEIVELKSILYLVRKQCKSGILSQLKLFFFENCRKLKYKYSQHGGTPTKIWCMAHFLFYDLMGSDEKVASCKQHNSRLEYKIHTLRL